MWSENNGMQNILSLHVIRILISGTIITKMSSVQNNRYVRLKSLVVGVFIALKVDFSL